ncbi:MAG: hypothetical protein WCV84_01440 [Patescibacteria group bacterium]
MWYIFIHGGWIAVLWVLLWGAKYLWLDYIQTKNYLKKEWVVLKVRVPRTSEQTPRAMENLFASFAGAHSPFSWVEIWIQGETQSQISVEIASNEGDVSYYVYCVNKMRDLVEAAIYAQYPDADIDVVPDYAKNVPQRYPDEVWDLWGCEFMPVAPDPYPLKTYHDFEDAVSGEFKDPLAVLLENFSRLGPGEFAWYQMVIVPTDQKEERKRAQAVIDKLKGTTKKETESLGMMILKLPITVLGAIINIFIPPPATKTKTKEEGAFPRMMAMTPGERDVLEAVEHKASQIGFATKIRLVYVAKKEVMKKSRVAHPFIGAIKQMNTFDMQALKPDSKKTGVSGTLLFFKNTRNTIRKNSLIACYTSRASWRGLPRFNLCIEELATLWHFPILIQVKAPQLHRTQAKKSEPPANIPFGM